MQDTLNGTSEPFRIYWTCYQVLSANKDPRAYEILQAAYQRLQTAASKMDEPALRHSFLENVVIHQLIVDAWAQQHEVSEN
jgi:hypothetical protein